MSVGSNLVDAVVTLENSASALNSVAVAMVAAKADTIPASDAQALADRINAIAIALTNTANTMK